jgi:hypothetical protein
MKELTILLILVVSVSLAAAVEPLSVWLAPAAPQQNEYIYNYGYQDASVVVKHLAVVDNFKGALQATGLKPGFTYQVKLEGPGSLASTTEERLANEMIGFSGRWWYNGNQNDAFYIENKSTVDIIGYLVFDFFTADENGNANVNIVSDESYHVLWCGPTAYSNTFLYPVNVTQSPFSDYTLKCVLPMLCHADDVIPEIERPEFSALPEGDYPNVRLVLTEESFHQSCGTWSTVMGAETSFSIIELCEGNFDNDNDVDVSDLAIFAADFGRTNCGSPPTCEGDFDTDGDVDGSDLATFAADFGRTDCPLVDE